MTEDDRADPKGAPLALNVLQAEPLHQLEFGVRLELLPLRGSLERLASASCGRARRAGSARGPGDAAASESGREHLLVGELLASLAVPLFVLSLPALLLGHAGDSASETPAAGDGFLLFVGCGRRRLAAAELVGDEQGSDQDGDQSDGDLGEEAAGDRSGGFGNEFLPERGRGFVRHLRAPDASD